MRSDCCGIDFVLDGNRENNRLKGFRFCLESERFVQSGEAQFRFQRDIEREGSGARSFAAWHIV